METFFGQPFNVRRAVTFAMRSSRAGSEGLLTQARDAILGVKADVSLTRVRTLGDAYGSSIAATSFALTGVACGLAGAAALSQLMASLLFGTSPLDPAIYVLVSLGLVSIAAIASYVPALRATLVDPVLTLRGE